MNLQALIDKMDEMDSQTRANYHLTLGGLQDALSDADDGLPVVFDSGDGAGEIASYRGYYIDLAISGGKPKPVSDWKRIVEKALATTFVGYKGGDFPASPDKPLWRAKWGDASGIAIVSAAVTDGAFVLATKAVE